MSIRLVVTPSGTLATGGEYDPLRVEGDVGVTTVMQQPPKQSSTKQTISLGQKNEAVDVHRGQFERVGLGRRPIPKP